MKNQTNKPHTPPNREEIQAFLKGTADKNIVRKIEESISDGGFEAEAMEGLVSDPEALNLLPEQLTNGKLNSTGSGSVYKWLFWPTLAIAVIAVIVSLNHNREYTTPIVAGTKEMKPNMEEVLNAEAEQQNIENAILIDETEQITYAKTKADQPKTIIASPEKSMEPTQEKTSDPVKPIDPIGPENLVPEKEEKVAHSNVKFTYMNDLKVIDYSDLYTAGIKKTEIVLTGTPANVGDGSTASTENEMRTVFIPYEKFLMECMESFSKNQFKSALKNYLIILQHYPDDLNAHFYGGLCYYNLGKFDKAVLFFDKCIYNAYSTFEEEAEWYKALCLIKLSKDAGAKELLQRILLRKGFYASRAEKTLSELK